MSQRNPRMIGGIYQVGQVITTGPLLTIYTAYNRNTGDVVGLNVIELPPSMDEAAVQRLLQPLERRRLVHSQHAIHVYDWGIDGTRVYIATDPPRGLTLRQVLDTENVDMQRAIDIAQQMARGLLALQSPGIFDIDLRPQLITVDIVGATDRVQLDDIGLRLLLKQLGYVDSQRGDDIGYLNPRYTAPEHIQNGPVGPWSDVYQVGLLIFEVVTGRLPFVGRNPAETGVLQTTGPVPRMAQLKHDTPPALQELVDIALAKDPARRFPNAEALLKALETVSPLSKPASSSVAASLTPAAGSLPAVKSTSLTKEMAALSAGDDVSLQSTYIEGEPTIRRSPAGSQKLSLHGENEKDVLAYLCFEPEGGETQRFPITSNYVIVGRVDPKRGLNPEVDLSAIDPRMTVSRQHARIRYEKTFFYIEDLKSRNKTRLGELTLVPLKAELLQHGDVLYFGSVRMVFRVPGMKDAPVIKER